MKKKILVIALSCMLVALLGYGTIAYFTQSTNATNTITAGNVEIALLENDMIVGETYDSAVFDGVHLEGFMPGASADKKVQIRNTGDNAAWVRLKVDMGLTLPGATPQPTPMPEVGGAFNLEGLLAADSKWVAGAEEGVYYYTEALQAGETTEPLFEGVKFLGDAGNEYSKLQFSIDLTAQAVQQANNGDVYTDVQGWPDF